MANSCLSFGDLAGLTVDLARCPWAPAHRLVRIGLKGRESDNPASPIAREVKAEVEFNPARVASYRLIGYDERQLPNQDHNGNDARAVSAGHTVTALYEIVPLEASASPAAAPPETLTVKLSYKKPNGDGTELVEQAVADADVAFANASPDFKFAAAVAEFGMLLRGSEHKGNGTLGAVLQWAEEGKGGDANGSRASFLEVVRKAQVLSKG